jgi:ribosomal-protein-alanine N-acetyltransferase
MHLRPYEPADRDTCLAIFRSNMPLYFLPEEEPDFEGFLNEQNARCLQPESGEAGRWEPRYYVGELNGEAVACGGFGRSRDGQHLTLIWGMVAREHHRQGLGRELLGYRLTESAKHFPGELLFMDTTQHSRPFFERFGFRVIKHIPNGYGPGMDRFDMEYGAGNDQEESIEIHS